MAKKGYYSVQHRFQEDQLYRISQIAIGWTCRIAAVQTCRSVMTPMRWLAGEAQSHPAMTRMWSSRTMAGMLPWCLANVTVRPYPWLWSCCVVHACAVFCDAVLCLLSMFGSRNKHAARSFSTPRVFTWWRSSRLDSMEMTPEQLEQLSAHLCQSTAGNVERRLEEWWQNQSGSSGKGGGGKGGHAIIEPKYLSRVKDFLGDEHSWKDWFASLTTAVIQMYTWLTRWKGLLSARRAFRTGTRLMIGLIATSMYD